MPATPLLLFQRSSGSTSWGLPASSRAIPSSTRSSHLSISRPLPARANCMAMPASRLPHPTRTRALELLAAAAFIGLSWSAAFANDAVDVDETTFPWSAVGKIYNSARSSCTGSLIARDKVLTAAHCLFNRATIASYSQTPCIFCSATREVSTARICVSRDT
jgi:V8-like Glu-specific endopeptidase